MPVTLTDVDSFDDVTAPAGSDVRNAASVQVSMQTVANRTRNLKNRVDAADAALASEQAAREAGDATTVPGLRLSLDSSKAVTTTDVSAASTLYYVPQNSGRVGLYYGGAWNQFVVSTFVSLALSGMVAGTNYDVFAYYDGVTVQLELGPPWTDATTRSEALARQDGVLVRGTDPTRRYIGTIRATGATTTEDSASKRFVWNQYNRAPRTLVVQETSISWTYGTGAWRQARGSSTNKVEYVTGDDATLLDAEVQAFAQSSAAGGAMSVGIGIDATTANSAQVFGVTSQTAGVGSQHTRAAYRGYPGAGYHAINWLEYGSATVTYYSQNGSWGKSGIVARVEG